MAEFLRYVASDENTFPAEVIPSTFVYSHTITSLDDGTYRYSLTSDDLPTKVSFNRVETLLKLEYLDTSNINTFYYMFNYCTNLTEVNSADWDTSKVTNIAYMFAGCSSLATLDVSNWDTSKVTTLQNTFQNCSSLTTLDVSKWNTSAVTNSYHTFNNCKLLTTLDVSTWNTSAVTTMYNMFNGCSSLTTLNVSKWNTENVISFFGMFYGCNNLTRLEMGNWNTSNVTNMYNMFGNCHNLTSLDLSKWVTFNVTNMSMLFNSCIGLKSLDLSTWNTSNVTNMTSMFYNCRSLTLLDVSGWDTSNVTSTNNMFINVTNADLGLLDCSLDTVNTIASAIANNTGINIWVYEEDLTQYNQYENVTYHTHSRENATSVDLYLSRPLQSGERIESIDGKTYHIYSDVYEEISEHELIIDSFPGGIIDFNSNVNVPRVDFKALEIPLIYIPDEPTIFQYIDGEGVQQTHNLSGVTNPLKCNDIGYTISKVQLVNSANPFGYFNGLCSIGQNLRVTVKFVCPEDGSYTTRTFVLTSPLLQGDKLFSDANGIFIKHNSGIREYKEGDLGTYITDLVNTVYTLETPYYEKISEPIKFNKPYTLVEYDIKVGE